jgi:exonuclease III
MNVFWINIRKRGRDRSVLRALARLVALKGIDVLFLQETSGKGLSYNFDTLDMRPVSISNDLSAFVSRKIPEISLLQMSASALVVQADDVALLNVHLSAYSSSIRAKELAHITDIIGKLRMSKVVIGGDFNLAPRECDGLFDGTPSTWTGQRERAIFQELTSKHGFVDLLAADGQKEFSIERVRQSKSIQFRCDLILCSNELLACANAEYVHETRKGPWSFSDHSGLHIRLET